MAQLRFQSHLFREWSGRYAVIPGDDAKFHVQAVSGTLRVVVYWLRDDCRITCPSLDSRDMRSLIDAVSQAKTRMGGSGRGSFQINEYGQVIVPASDGSGRRMLAGEITGDLEFEDGSEPGRVFGLAGDHGLKCGDPWPLPYVGIPYNMSGRSQIYFWRQDGSGGQSEYPDAQDTSLVHKLRTIRRSGAVRFVVNPHGIVLTKSPSGPWSATDDRWNPVYVGRVNPECWFAREE